MKAFLKEQIWNLVMYVGAAGIVALILYLYGVPEEVIQYTMLLLFVWGMTFFALQFFRYSHRERILVDNYRKILTDVDNLPKEIGTVEQMYQKLVRELFEQKKEQESQERISRQEMSDYYGMWVHQIKNPIAALKALIQTCESEWGKADAQQLMQLKEMKIEVFRIEQYVEMVLTYLRMEDMSSDLSFEIYALDDIVKQAVKKNSQMFIFRKIRLEYEPLDCKVLTDEKWLVFVLEQILSNALKYTKKGSISIYMEGQTLVIADTGIGIQSEDLPRVFEKGFTGYNGRTDKKSTGIGLYLCKNIMDKLGQRIWIESEIGNGTKVYLQTGRKGLDTRD